ncbi:argininosuccinate lyase [Sulfoacidibacillus thermotolerans]|uniref:Argininosuccinate lyase n=1 Tax=Sulfoacidibacillus thermotolerans TaxID=1765684 RepID=A0A2U3D8P2_SULT2|nr:argininosuccinate lyase [Sulfoacidibacillus thermotolerans]PWI57646.1 argininosuccinate lyase [Sulfoacidibacillus thermotolerans]
MGKQSNAMWGGRFTKQPDELVEAFGASIAFDQRLAFYDIAGSKAHIRMLAKQQVVTEQEAQMIVEGLDSIREEIEAGTFVWEQSLEDVHMNIEHHLIERIGAVGGKLHTGRSRNDQVALDMHLFALEEVDVLVTLVTSLQTALCDCAERNFDVIIPGYTHLQRAQPVLFAHHLLAYVWMLARDRERLFGVRKRADLMPLGAGALAGTTFPIDRTFVASELGFTALYENSMDAVSDRDYVIEMLATLSVVMMHLSRLAEEIILWSSAEFGFLELDDAYTTGSSMMPQKKNPDMAELVRGKTGRVYGHLLGMLTTCKGLPLTYNKDMQEDKEGLFDAVDTVKTALRIFTGMIETLTVRTEAVESALRQDFSAATDVADLLVRKGVPFREAHEIVGNMVRYCIETKKPLAELSKMEIQRFTPLLDEQELVALTPQALVAARNCRGGTAPEAVRKQLQWARERLELR